MKTIFQFIVAGLMVLGLSASTVNADNWYSIASGTSKKLNCIYFPSASIGYIGGEDSLLLKTIDGGQHWQQMQLSGVNFPLGNAAITNLQFLNDTVGFIIVGPFGGCYGTEDGGFTWIPLSLPSNQCFVQGLYFFDENNGFVGGSGCFSGELISSIQNSNWKTTTFSLSNVPNNFSSQFRINDFDFQADTLGLAASESGYIFRSTDGGNNWDSIRVSQELNPLTSVLFVNDTLVYAGYNAIQLGFGLYVSHDAGLTWSQDLNSATFYYPDFLALHKTASGKVYTGGVSQNNQGLIFSESNASGNWSFQQVFQKINSIYSYSDSIVFAVGDSGYITCNHLLQPNSISNQTQVSSHLHIYPNTSHGEIKLLGLKRESNPISVRVYSENGNFIKEISGKTSIQLGDLSKGIYLIEVITKQGKQVEKLLLE